MPAITVFDKQVNLYLYRADGTLVAITTLPTGRKVSIRLTGEMVAQDVIQQMDIRVTNFTTDEPLSAYVSVEVEVGYQGAIFARMKGAIVNSFRETPGPDGVTVFQMLTGDFDVWTQSILTGTWASGTSLNVVLLAVASALGLTLLNYADESLQIPVAISHNGKAKELMKKLLSMFETYDANKVFTGLVVRPDGKNLIAYTQGRGTGIVHQLALISSASRNAAGFDIQAPWDPSLRPGDTVQVNPVAFSQQLGSPGSLGNPDSIATLFQVIHVGFSFDTDGDENMMTVTTVGGE